MPTKTIKLHTALKIKNRIAGEVARLQRLIVRENSRRSDNKSKVDVADLINKLGIQQSNLAALKGAIAISNIIIYPKLAAMAEHKAQIAHLQSIPTREGEEIVTPHFGGSGSVTYQWTAHLNQAAIDQLIVDEQQKINNLQDEVDAYNAGTSITVNLN